MAQWVTIAADDDARFMREAMLEADEAGVANDVPVGALVVDAAGRIVGRGRNRREADQGSHRARRGCGPPPRGGDARPLAAGGATIYVTLEPCPMCAGALVNARIARLVYGCADPKAGAVDTLFTIGRDPRLNHRFTVTAGVLGEECAAQLRAFFARLRRHSKAASPRDPGTR